MVEQDGPPKLTPDELKLTPNSARELRFGPNGERRPHAAASAAQEPDRKPVNLKRVRNRTYNVGIVAFGAIVVLMAVGAATVFYLNNVDTPEAAPAEVADDGGAADGEDKELQGGVKVRKGFGG